MYHSLVYPYLYYGNICWGSTYSTRLDSIRKIQKKIIRLIVFAEYKEHTTPLFIRLSMLQLDDINLQVTALFMFRFFNNMLPDSFNDYFMLNRELHHYNTRLSVCVHKNYARTNYSKHLVNRPRSIYQYSSMAPRLSGQNCKFFKFLLSLNSQKRLGYKENNTKYRSLTRKPRSHVRILIYRTWPIIEELILGIIYQSH